MNPHKFTVTCRVCGGEGVGTVKTAAAAWDAHSFVSHRDPSICVDVIARRKAQDDPIAFIRSVARKERAKAQQHLRNLVK